MSQGSHFAVLATDLLRDEEIHRPPPSPADEARAIARLEQAILENSQRRRNRAWMGVTAGLVAVAACATVVVWAARSRFGSPSTVAEAQPMLESTAGHVQIVRGQSDLGVTRGLALRDDDHIVVDEGSDLALQMDRGVTAHVESGSKVTLARRGHRIAFMLEAGFVRLSAGNEGSSESNVVVTRDAEVELSAGTSRVGVVTKSACGVSTRIHVETGTATIRSGGVESHLGAGESWPLNCEATAESDSVLTVQGNAPIAAPAPQPSASASARSFLAEQNDLFGQATTARRRGDTRGAIAAYERFIARYPSGPLTESAYAERFRLLAAGDRGRARDAASQYLQRYPKGFAKDDARTLIEGK